MVHRPPGPGECQEVVVAVVADELRRHTNSVEVEAAETGHRDHSIGRLIEGWEDQIDLEHDEECCNRRKCVGSLDEKRIPRDDGSS